MKACANLLAYQRDSKELGREGNNDGHYEGEEKKEVKGSRCPRGGELGFSKISCTN
jgi:hypothetical protein